MSKYFRNIAIVAHIDHGKTTLVDQLLKQSNEFNNIYNNQDRIMDYHQLEKERGITISSKNTAIMWKNYRINIIDTPGHADFSGEVERVMSMVDSVLLVVDATEGPMPQTNFVTQISFKYGLKPIVVINKIDRPESRPIWVINQIFDLFIKLNATEKQLDFPVIYTSAIQGRAGIHFTKLDNDMSALYQSIVENVLPPKVNLNAPLQMQISQLENDNYLGIIGIGRITSGTLTPDKQVNIIDSNGNSYKGKISKIFNYLNLKRINTNFAEAGDIVAITGLSNLRISDTVCDLQYHKPLPPLRIEKPTVTMYFHVNNSPFCNKESKFNTARQLFARLSKEILFNISLNVEKTNHANVFRVSGRGILHLSILIENMRREGFELAISQPNIIIREIDGNKCEPFENLVINIEERHQGFVIQEMGKRKAILKNINQQNQGRLCLDYIISTRNLIGLRNKFIMMTSGTGILYSSFSHYDNILPTALTKRPQGVLIANKSGKATAFAIFHLQNRGQLFIHPGEDIYEGQIIGIHNRYNDLVVNCITEKKLTNIRASSADEAIVLIKYNKMNLENALEFIDEGELVEVTPCSIRMRKYYLTHSERKFMEK